MTLRPPKQARSRRTLDRLVEAAMSLMEDQGVEGTSVAEVVNAAQSSVGSFYARFEGKDDFVGYLEARVWADATQRWDQAVADIQGRHLTAQDLVTGVVRLLIDTRKADLERRRVLGTASGSVSHARAFHAHVLSGILDLLRPYRDEFGHHEPERAVRIAYAVLAGALDRLPELRSAAGGSTETLVDEMARLFLAYLGSDAARGAIRRVDGAVPATVQPKLTLTGPVTPHLPTVAEAPPLPAAMSSSPVPMIPEAPPPAAVTPAQAPPLPMVAAERSEPGPDGASAAALPNLQAAVSPPAARPTSVREEPEAEEERERVDFFDVWG
jgi:AcrR family transcriptional regulator